MSDGEQRSNKRRKVGINHDDRLLGENGPLANVTPDQNTINVAAAARRAAQQIQQIGRSSINSKRPITNSTHEPNDRELKNDINMTDAVRDPGDQPSADDSDDEPRRSGRQRKPSAKILSNKREEAGPKTPKTPRPRGTPQFKSNAATNIEAATQSMTRPIVNSTHRSTTAKTKELNGKQKSDSQPLRTLEVDKTPPPTAPFTTPRKRGRPPGSSKKATAALIGDETPKALRFDLTVEKADDPGQDQDPFTSVVDNEIGPEDKSIIKELQATLDTLSAKLEHTTLPTDAITNIVLKKLAQRRPTPLTHLQEEYDKVYTLLESTVTAGEGNSMVIVGARGSGKTTLVNKALAELGRTQKEYFHIVRLNGFIQTDDKLALREIWRQLGREMDLEEEDGGGTSNSYADTLTMLLALLSHPDEIARNHDAAQASADGALTAAEQVAKSVIIVMDEFDLFATHARQTLLYNLLDIAQSRKAPIAVLGLTTKFDVTERLEKRVKSRFSHRYVHLPLAKSMRAFQDICKAAVSLQADELSFDEQLILSSSHSSESKSSTDQLRLGTVLAMWNTSVHLLFLNDDFNRAYLRDTFYLTKSVCSVLTSLLLPFSSLPTRTSDVTRLPVNHFLSQSPQHLQAPSSSLQILIPSLSELQLSLLIAAARLDIIHDSDTCSFGMAYSHYVELASKARLHSAAAGALATGGAGARVWGRDVARGEWEILIRRGLLLPVSELSSVTTAVASLGSLVKVDVKLEEISGSVKGISATLDRWCKQI